MQTQCPHCNTRFRITETQANLAEGFVRCSVCKEVFNAFTVANHHHLQTSLLEDTAEDEAIQSHIAATDAIDESNNVVEETAVEHESNPSGFLQDTTTQKNTEDLSGADRHDVDETSISKKPEKDSFDFFDVEDNSQSHVVPEKFRDSYAASSSLISNLLWAVGTLILTATLASQYAWFNRSQLNQIPQIQAWFEEICQQYECHEISMRDPRKIELISRNVYSHPNEKKALMINITMKNNADFAQPYPVMQVGFSDIRGSTVAARRFRPEEYLATPSTGDGQQTLGSQASTLFEPGTNMTFTMEIQDPGKQAMTYEFDFL